MKSEKSEKSARYMMLAIGWFFILGLPVMAYVFPTGYYWGTHPDSHYDPLSPYAYMLTAVYFSLGVMIVWGARAPRQNAIIVDFLILSSLLHGGVMAVQAVVLPHEMQHMWGDVLMFAVVIVAALIWHPRRNSE